jgi:hypothetical protein
LTDGRLYVPGGRAEGEFVIFFGRLVSGPTRPAASTLVTPFFARVVQPKDSEPLLFQAHLDFPLLQEPGEGPFVLLHGALPEEVPAGSVITSR